MTKTTDGHSAPSDLITPADAIDRVLVGARRLAPERVPLELADGRVLAEDIIAVGPVPAKSTCSRDGYALACADLAGEGPWAMPVRNESRAGHAPPAHIAGSACRVFTGAEVPPGADAVVMQEDVLRRGDEVVLASRPSPGGNVRAAGSDLAAGAKALARGTRLTPGRLGVAAYLDRPYLRVARKPVLSLLSTGDELRSPGDPPRPNSIVESSSFVVAAWARQLGAEVRHLPVVHDNAEQTRRCVDRAMRGADVVVTIGGVSVGDYDWIRPALRALGVSLDFQGVAMSPGRPLTAGRTESCRLLCLPGNAAAATLGFLLFGAPLLRALQGDAHPVPRRVPLRVIGSHVKPVPHEEYLRARLEVHDGELCAALLPMQSAGAVTGFVDAQGLVVLAADRKAIRHGDRLPVIELQDI